MTYREYYLQKHNIDVREGGWIRCPDSHINSKIKGCSKKGDMTCRECWDREMSQELIDELKETDKEIKNKGKKENNMVKYTGFTKFRGKLEEVPKFNNETLSEQCRRIYLSNTEIPAYRRREEEETENFPIDNYKTLLLWETNSYIVHEGVLYFISSIDNYYCEEMKYHKATINKENREISFEVKYHSDIDYSELRRNVRDALCYLREEKPSVKENTTTHKSTTYKEYFLSKFPNAVIDYDGYPTSCPDNIFGQKTHYNMCGEVSRDTCRVCTECWDRIMPQEMIDELESEVK